MNDMKSDTGSCHSMCPCGHLFFKQVKKYKFNDIYQMFIYQRDCYTIGGSMYV